MPSRSRRVPRTRDVLLAVTLVVIGLALVWGLVQGSSTVTLVCGAALAATLVLGGSLSMAPDDTRSQATERTLRMATNTLEHLHGGLTEENAQAVCALLLPETNASAIAITDMTHVLAFEGTSTTAFMPGSENSQPTLEVLRSKRMETFASIDRAVDDAHLLRPTRSRDSCGIIVPLLVQDKSVGSIKLYYQRDLDIDKTQLAIAQGLGTLLSTQLSFYELDLQSELTARAEVKALQAQINPHFLFNTLNTIASFTRTNPTKARDLLREFSLFYRRTLESSEQALIALEEELAQTRRYLTIERARFGEDRIIETEHVERGCESLQVPSFLIQPIAENAVRHAMRDEGPLQLDIHVVTDGGDVLISVIDDGLGMDDSVAERLLDDQATVHASGRRGTGMALRNVADRLERFFGPGSGVEILSKPGEGTCVTLRLVDAASQLARESG